MSQETTKAEQLARYVDMCVPGATAPKIAAELRRLDALNAQLLEALREAIKWDGCDDYGADAVWLAQADAAIAAATEVSAS